MIPLSHEELCRRTQPYYDVQPFEIPRASVPLWRRLFAWTLVACAMATIGACVFGTAVLAWMMVVAR